MSLILLCSAAFYLFGSLACGRYSSDYFMYQIDRDAYPVAMGAYVSSNLKSSMSWRVLLGVQIAPAGILALLVFLLPEVYIVHSSLYRISY